MNIRLLILLLVCSLCLGTHSNPKRFDWKCSDVVREMHGRTIGEIGVLITNRPHGAPAYYVWHPEQMYNWRPVCPDCRGPAKKHGWSKHVVCMASENCALLHPRYSCPTCSTSASTKTFTVCNIRDQWPQEVVDGFPFILTPNSGVDVTLFSMVLEGLVRQEQICSLTCCIDTSNRTTDFGTVASRKSVRQNCHKKSMECCRT